MIGEDRRHVVVQVDIADRAGLGRGEVEAAVAGLVEPQLLNHVKFPAGRVDAPGAVLQPEDFPESHSLTRTGPDSGLIFVWHHVDQGEHVVIGRDPLWCTGEAAQDREEPN
ncbi:hypothetical protein [Plantactinospora sonchi]|uniref:Uncharacterized protein n=1 Tax=Plantactinospora sonchi TaxID=1544735 RepID=A0ABU7RSK8_9ACTN